MIANMLVKVLLAGRTLTTFVGQQAPGSLWGTRSIRTATFFLKNKKDYRKGKFPTCNFYDCFSILFMRTKKQY